MKSAAERLDFEKAIELRDKLNELKKLVKGGRRKRAGAGKKARAG